MEAGSRDHGRVGFPNQEPRMPATAISHTIPAAGSLSFTERLNGPWHERAMQAFMVIVLAHWAEHLLQALQIYALGWPVPEARGLVGVLLPVGHQVGATALRLRGGDARGAVVAAAGIHGPRRSALVDGGARHPVLPPHRALPAADAVLERPQPRSAPRCRRASCSSWCRASSCTSSTTPSCSSRWPSRCITTCSRRRRPRG